MNETSLYLTQFVGVYLLLVGIVCVLRRKYFMHAVKEFIQNRAMRFLFPCIELAAGLMIVIVHNVWIWGPELIVTMVGWILVVEAAAYLLVPEKTLMRVLNSLNQDVVYATGGFASIALGLYLTSVAFGWTM